MYVQIVLVSHFLQSDSLTPSPLERWSIALSGVFHADKCSAILTQYTDSVLPSDTVALPNKLCSFCEHFLCALFILFFINNLFPNI